MSDVVPDKRCIWLMLDDAPQARKIPSITDALTTLRSKGVRVALGIQSLAQIRETYTKDTATTLAGQCAIKIIRNLSSTEDRGVEKSGATGKSSDCRGKCLWRTAVLLRSAINHSTA